jgi:ElaB/YqjD/DUF883 family membrane-anchored ribosome-binding protein
MKVAIALAAVLSVGVLAAGCGGSSEPSAQEASEKLCSELNQVRATLQPIVSPTSQTTVGDVENVKSDLESELDDVADAAKDVQAATNAQLDTAAENLKSSLESVPDSATLQEAAASAGTAIATFGTALKQTFNDVKCGNK